jgi:phytoene dehydrogenase-like protein
MNVALSELPRFGGLSEEEARPKLNGTIDICPSIAYAERAYDDAKAGAWASEPVVSMCLPSLLDDSLAPAGCHVMSLFCQHFNPELDPVAAGARSWDDVKEEVADMVIETVTRTAPNFRQAVVGRQVLSPLDLEREFGLVGGDIFHGALHLDQIYSLRCPAATRPRPSSRTSSAGAWRREEELPTRPHPARLRLADLSQREREMSRG